MGEVTNAYSVLVGKPEGKNHLEDLGVDGRIILECILRKQGEKVWTRCLWFRIGLVADSCELGNEPSGYIKGGKFLD
jgi:hypothetical protein